MSTNDVPGFNPDNRDELHGGCWAYHEDGTLLYVLGTENNRVLYELFDLSDPRNPVEYRDAMPQGQFERDFSYDPADPKSVKWTWKDKTAFPWDRIVKNFKQGVKPVAAEKVIKEAAKVKRVRQKHAGTKTGRVSSKKPALSNTPKQRKTIEQLTDEADERSASLDEARTTVAQRLAKARTLKASPIEHADVAHRVDKDVPKGGIAERVRNRLQSAINKLLPGKGE
jgi:hypothetical protein